MSSRLLALGDSYTVGEGVAREESWPSRLAARLRADGLEIGDLVIVARTGWTTDELLFALHSVQPGQFDLVTVLAGVNDQYRGRPIAEFAESYGRLLAAALSYGRGDARVLLALSIPDWGVTPFAESKDRISIAVAIDEFNRVARKEAEMRSIRWLDLTALSRSAADDLSLVAEDGLHPSAAAYEAWVDALEPEVRRILERR